jgi:hypothetical protein
MIIQIRDRKRNKVNKIPTSVTVKKHKLINL